MHIDKYYFPIYVSILLATTLFHNYRHCKHIALIIDPSSIL